MIELKLTNDDIQLILSYLSIGQYREVSDLINKITNQLK